MNSGNRLTQISLKPPIGVVAHPLSQWLVSMGFSIRRQLTMHPSRLGTLFQTVVGLITGPRDAKPIPLAAQLWRVAPNRRRPRAASATVPAFVTRRVWMRMQPADRVMERNPLDL